jgi:hypothetical protein
MMFFSLQAYSQSGVSLSYGSNGFLGFDIFYGDVNRFHIGYAFAGDGQHNTVVDVREPNYGLTRTGDGAYKWLVDAGYSRKIIENLLVGGEVSFGSEVQFVNYSDNRFSDGGYSLRGQKKTILGIGANASYFVSNNFEVFSGFNTQKGLLIGARYTFRFLAP